MKTPKSFPAISKACRYVIAKLDDGTYPVGERLAPIRNLAAMAGVSTATMVKAIDILKKEGRVHAIERHRLRAGNQPIAPIEHKDAPLRWEGKRCAVEKEILCGTFGDLLPTMKEMQHRYGVCFGTMQKILKALASDGIIKPMGRRYALPGHSSQPYANRISFIIYKGYFTQESALNHKNNRVINLFENEALRKGFALEITEIDFYDSEGSLQKISALNNTTETAGYILDTHGSDSAGYQQSLSNLLSRVASFKKPLAVLDDGGTFKLPAQFQHNPFFQVYYIESKRAGERMARYLIDLGHRSALYISPLHYSWSRDRFDGVRAQFIRAGLAEGIHLVSSSSLGIWPDFLTASGVRDDNVRQLLHFDNTPAQIADLERQWEEFKSDLKHNISKVTRLKKSQADYMNALVTFNKKQKEVDFVNGTYQGAMDMVADQVFKASMLPILKQAIGYRNVTAWICANDRTALIALEFLRHHGIPVPDSISVVGFDNIAVDSLEQDLTTLDFNAMGFIHLILNFIARPPRPRGLYSHSPIEVESVIIKRGTTKGIKP